MKALSAAVLFFCLSSVALAERVELSPEQMQANRQACFRIMQELKEIKFLRDQQMDTGGPKNLLEIEREWQGKYQSNGCSIWRSQFDGR